MCLILLVEILKAVEIQTVIRQSKELLELCSGTKLRCHSNRVGMKLGPKSEQLLVR